MPMDNLNPETRRAIADARRVALSLEHLVVRPEHLLIGLFAVPESTPARILLGYGLHAQLATARVAALAPPGSVPAGPSAFSAATREVIRSAARISRLRGNEHGVDVVSLALAVLGCEDPMVAEVLAAVNTAPQTALAALEAATSHATDPGVKDEYPGAAAASSPIEDQPTPGTTDGSGMGGNDLVGTTSHPAPAPTQQVLGDFGDDLVARAVAGDFDEVTGRETELEQMMVVLGRRSKNNPILLGEPGVGKTAVVEALAQRIAAGTVPDSLAGRPLVSLDVGSLVAGARYRGDFEQRLKNALKQAVAASAIVFIDEIHQVIGAGSTGGGMDMANMLKPAIARGELCLIGATTLEEYRKHVESDAALARRFQPVHIGEPSVEQTVAILTTLAPKYAEHHLVSYTPAALRAAAQMSDHYVTDRFLPDKAIDLIDEAGAAAAMRLTRAPGVVRDLYRRRAHHRAALATSGDDQLAARAAHRELATIADQLTAEVGPGVDLEVVDADQVAEIISAATGVPVTAIAETEATSLREMPDRLAARVIGQDAAIDAVTRAVRRARQRLSERRRPASFIFAGPTGVGKTELAKALADDLFGDDAAGRGRLIALDMSEYAEKQSAAKLFGSPPGYVGHEDGGQLTEQVRRSKYAVVLLDEIEKAHPEICDTLLQVLEEGRMTDGTGRVVDFSNTIVILTTNLGASATTRPAAGFGHTGAAAAGIAEAQVASALRDHFRPEFLNRVDDVVVFTPLSRDHLDRVVGNLVAPIRSQLAERGIELELTEDAIGTLLEAGYDPTMGARPLRRAITTMLTDPIADVLLDGTLVAGRVAIADRDPDDIARLRITVTDAVDLVDDGSVPGEVGLAALPAGA